MTRADRIDRGKLKFRLGAPHDVEAVVRRFGVEAFEETGFSAFAVLDLDRAVEHMRRQVQIGMSPFVIAEVDDELAGVGSYRLDHTFTADPIAHLWMIFVPLKFRRGPLGRMLIWHLMNLAKGDGATAFFAAVPATHDTARGLCNLLERLGCTPMRGAYLRRL